MKIIKGLCNVNVLALASYIPYIIINFDDFFFGKTKQVGVIGILLFMFFATFVCAGVIFVTCNKKNVDMRINISEVKKINKSTLISLFIIYVLGLVVMFLRIHDEAIIFYFAVSTITFVFIIVEKILIPKIDISPVYKISIPWYVYPIPFVIFIGGNFILTDILSEEKEGTAAIILLILTGAMLAFLAWHSSFIIDEESKTIVKDEGIFSLFNPKVISINFDDVSCVKKQGIYYIIVNGDSELKINRLFSGIKKFNNTLKSEGIVIV